MEQAQLKALLIAQLLPYAGTLGRNYDGTIRPLTIEERIDECGEMADKILNQTGADN